MSKDIFMQTQEAMHSDMDAMKQAHAETVARLEAELLDARKS